MTINISKTKKINVRIVENNKYSFNNNNKKSLNQILMQNNTNLVKLINITC